MSTESQSQVKLLTLPDYNKLFWHISFQSLNSFSTLQMVPAPAQHPSTDFFRASPGLLVAVFAV